MADVCPGPANGCDWGRQNDAGPRSLTIEVACRPERHQMRHRMHMADGNKAGVPDLLADDCQRTDESFPCRVDIRRFH
jgi:hypothetical protein